MNYVIKCIKTDLNNLTTRGLTEKIYILLEFYSKIIIKFFIYTFNLFGPLNLC